jgi:hypothetical protein
MAQGLRYADAVKLLGGASPAVKAVDNLLGGALAVATGGGSEVALSLFDAKAEVIRLGHVVADKLQDRVRGLGRYDRSSRLQAAHGILVVSSFFEAFDEIVAATELQSPELTRDDQVMLAAGTQVTGDWLLALINAPLPVPAPDRSYTDLLDELGAWYLRAAAHLREYLEGLAVWENASDGVRRAADTLITTGLPASALRRYEEAHRRLAVDIPEFDVWVRRAEARAVGRSLRGLQEVLQRASSGLSPGRRRVALAAAYRADLDRPVAGGDTGELVIPTLGEAYLDPRFQAKAAGPSARPAEQSWWDGEVRADLAAFLAEYLMTPQAADAPLLLLGQPGAGKSALTRVLSARLPAADFLVVRVALREVPAEAEVQDQVEQAVRGAIGETVGWTELAESAAGALPLILLDGFDELLQATGIHQSDYLQRVAAFQHREKVQGRPVAVIVTSRVAVADRARLPAGSLAVRLEGFDGPQVARWLDTWNSANAARPGHRPLPADVVGRFPEFCEQPLLLLMLALYDATTNALQQDADFDTTELYERLLGSFAEREVRRLHHGEPERLMPALVEAELLRLSVVAFAMFNRGRQWITEQELDADLAGLGIAAVRPGETATFRSPLTAGEELVGRFFFIQRAKALRDGRTLQTYEFLHATFGEYLVARLVVHALRDTAAREAAGTLPLAPGSRDDGLLQALLGFTPLTARGTVLPFVTTLLAGADRVRIREFLVRTLRVAVIRPEYGNRPYRPVDKRVDHWMATYSLNLTLLSLACGEPLRASELFQHAADPAAWLRGAAQQWTAAVPSGMWSEVADTLTISRCWDGDRRDLMLEARPGRRIDPVEPRWTFHGVLQPGARAFGSRQLEQLTNALQLTGDAGADVLRHALEPLTDWVSETTTNFVVHGPSEVESVARSLTQVWISSTLGSDPSALASDYARAFRAFAESDWSRERPGRGTTHAIRLLLRMLINDAPRLPAADVGDWLSDVLELPGYDDTHAPDVLECLAATEAGPGDGVGALADLVIAYSGTPPWQPLDKVRMAVALVAVKDDLPESALESLRLEYLPDARTALLTPQVREALQADRALARRVRQAFSHVGDDQ